MMLILVPLLIYPLIFFGPFAVMSYDPVEYGAERIQSGS